MLDDSDDYRGRDGMCLRHCFVLYTVKNIMIGS
jgi:hypothetical protein